MVIWGLAALAAVVVWLAVVVWIARGRSALARTTRKVAVHLPIVRDPAAQRIGALVGLADRTCLRCEHFDLRAGQELLAKNPAFRDATKWLTPTQMGEAKRGELAIEPGTPNPDLSGLRWESFGACSVHSELRAATDSCKEWT